MFLKLWAQTQTLKSWAHIFLLHPKPFFLDTTQTGLALIGLTLRNHISIKSQCNFGSCCHLPSWILQQIGICVANVLGSRKSWRDEIVKTNCHSREQNKTTIGENIVLIVVSFPMPHGCNFYTSKQQNFGSCMLASGKSSIFAWWSKRMLWNNGKHPATILFSNLDCPCSAEVRPDGNNGGTTSGFQHDEECCHAPLSVFHLNCKRLWTKQLTRQCWTCHWGKPWMSMPNNWCCCIFQACQHSNPN